MTAVRHRALWSDARFFIGLALVALSVAGVWVLVSGARQTAPVLQASHTLVAGHVVTSADLRVVDAALGAAEDVYLTPGALEPGLVAARTIEEGELIPAEALIGPDRSRTTSLVIETAVGLPSSIATGASVELWHAPPAAEGDGLDAPRILVADVTVASLVEAEGMLSQQRPGVEIVIDRADVADVLGAITGGSELSLVPAGAVR